MCLQLVKLHQQLAESTVALRDVKSKLTTVKSESAAQIEHLNQRVRQAEAKVSEEAKDKMDALAKLSAVESNVWRALVWLALLCSFVRLVLTWVCVDDVLW